MNIEQLRHLCLSFPNATEDVKWGNDLCFLIGQKMFCATSIDADQGASFKVRDDEFEAMTHRDGIIPAPYLARAKWVYVIGFEWLTDDEWAHFLRQSYELVKGKLPKNLRDNL